MPEKRTPVLRGFPSRIVPRQQLFKPPQVAAIVGRSVSTIWRGMKDGRIDFERTPFGRMVGRAELERILGRKLTDDDLKAIAGEIVEPRPAASLPARLDPELVDRLVTEAIEQVKSAAELQLLRLKAILNNKVH